MKKVTVFLVILCTLSQGVHLAAQESRFGASLILGLNAAQIRGDFSAGFNQLGLTAGVKGITNLSEQIDLNVELLYNQRGSRNDIFGPSADLFSIRLNYLDIPVTLSVNDWLVGEGSSAYHKVHGHAGISVSRLISASVMDPTGVNDDVLEENFETNELSWLIGGGIRFSKNIGFTLRYTRALGLSYEDDSSGQTIALRSYFLTFRLEYTL